MGTSKVKSSKSSPQTAKKLTDSSGGQGTSGLMPGGVASNSPLGSQSPLTPLETELAHFALSSSPRGCLVTIRNATTADREALVVAAGAHFWFYEEPKVGARSNDYMAGPVHVEVGSGATVPFRFSDPRKPVFKVAVGLRVLFGNSSGFPPAHYENYFWEMDLPVSPLISPPPLYPRVGEIHLDFRMKRDLAIDPSPTTLPGPTLGIPSGLRWPPIPGAPSSAMFNWFELGERPR